MPDVSILFMAFGTIQNGIIICTNDGRIVQKINRDNGLQNNTVLCMMDDMLGNLWLGTDNGIDYIEINSPLSIISYEYGISAGYTSVLFDGILYLGTNQGVFYKEWNDFILDSGVKKFKIIESTRGQVWSLQEIDGQLFCGNNNGTFLIKDITADKICDVPGCWTFIMPDSHSDKIIGGAYSGLVLFRKYESEWRFVKKISGFDESSRVMEIDNNSSLWMTHGLKGAFRISLNHDLGLCNKCKFL